jgi:ribose 5-phosphate isomerase B
MSIGENEIAAMVRDIVSRTLGEGVRRTVIDEDLVRQIPVGSTQPVPPDTLVTPLARQLALERRIELVPEDEAGSRKHVASGTSRVRGGKNRYVALGADHGGFEMKEMLKTVVADEGYGVIDCGTDSTSSVDYPDFAYAVARLVADGRAWRGIIIDGAGIGSSMAANKVPGVRAALCYDQATAVNSREHNNANVLTLGAGLIGPGLAGQIVRTWLSTDFGGGRHARRVDKIDAIGRRYSK